MAQVTSKTIELQRAILRVCVPDIKTKICSDVFLEPFEKEFFHAFPLFKQVLDEIYQNIQKSFEQQLQTLFDDQPPFELKEVLLTGSFREGLLIYEPDAPDKSDFDFMCCIKNISFSGKDQACGDLDVKEVTPFVNAYITNPELLTLWKDFLEEPTEKRKGQRLSARKLKQKLFSNYKRSCKIVHPPFSWEKSESMGDGPSLKVSERKRCGLGSILFDPCNMVESLTSMILNDTAIFGNPFDIVLAIPCEDWPSCSLEWIDRERFWPEKELIQKIVRQGFHIVPKSSAEGEFRLSFSKAEIILLETASPIKIKVLRAFKAIVKDHQNEWGQDIEDLICTYYLKTIAFWHLEKCPHDSWTEDNVVSHLLSLLDKFAQALRNRNLPMYFLPRYNLLKGVGTPERMQNISGKLIELTRDITRITKTVGKLKNTYYTEFMLPSGKKFPKSFQEKKDDGIFPPLD